MLNFLKNLGPLELIIIFGIILLFFGARMMKGLGRGLGESAREAKKLKDEVKKLKNDEPAKEESSE